MSDNRERSTVCRTRVCMLTLYVFAATAIAYPYSRFGNRPQETRKIVSEDFTKHRQGAPASDSRTGAKTQKPKSGAGTSKQNPAKSNRVYRYASSSGPKTRPSSMAATASLEQLGITLWRLRPAKSDDTGTRMLVREKGKSSDWIPERVEA